MTGTTMTANKLSDIGDLIKQATTSELDEALQAIGISKEDVNESDTVSRNDTGGGGGSAVAVIETIEVDSESDAAKGKFDDYEGEVIKQLTVSENIDGDCYVVVSAIFAGDDMIEAVTHGAPAEIEDVVKTLEAVAESFGDQK